MGTPKAPPLVFANAPATDPKTGFFTADTLRWFQLQATQIFNALSGIGEIVASAIIQGRTAGIGDITQNLTDAGKVNSTANVIDGPGSPLAGGDLAFRALEDPDARLKSSFHANPVDVSTVPTESFTLSNDGVSTAITVTSNTNQYSFGQKSYNSGSVDPGTTGKFIIYFDDPDFTGGAVIYKFTQVAAEQTAAVGRIPVGSITTSGAPATGGGDSGGSTGDPGGRGFIAA